AHAGRALEGRVLAVRQFERVEKVSVLRCGRVDVGGVGNKYVKAVLHEVSAEVCCGLARARHHVLAARVVAEADRGFSNYLGPSLLGNAVLKVTKYAVTTAFEYLRG